MAINIKSCESLCHQGSAIYNEDVIGITPWGAWVLDGATGLNNKNLISDESDAKWYVSWWNDYLYKNINKEKSLKDILINGVINIREEYYLKVNKNKIEKLDMPSSSIGIIKYHEDNIEYLLLGDCSLHIKDKEEIEIIKDKSLCKLDQIVYKEMKQLKNLNELSFEEIKSSVMKTIINNRLKRNTENGYWILEFEEKAIEKSIFGKININQDIKLMLTSDGYSCVSDRYNLIDENNLINEAIKNGVSSIYKELRNFEEEDFSTTKFPRFKIKDDSSCILLNLSFNNK